MKNVIWVVPPSRYEKAKEFVERQEPPWEYCGIKIQVSSPKPKLYGRESELILIDESEVFNESKRIKRETT